jgi:hypothetical protein
MSYIRTGRRDYSEAYRPGFKPRNKTISFTVSEDEAIRIDQAAEAAGLTRSAYLTKTQIAALPKPEEPAKPATKKGKRA